MRQRADERRTGSLGPKGNRLKRRRAARLRSAAGHAPGGTGGFGEATSGAQPGSVLPATGDPSQTSTDGARSHTSTSADVAQKSSTLPTVSAVQIREACHDDVANLASVHLQTVVVASPGSSRQWPARSDLRRAQRLAVGAEPLITLVPDATCAQATTPERSSLACYPPASRKAAR